MNWQNRIKSPSFIISAFVLLIALIIFSFASQSTTDKYSDPIPQAVDDEVGITSRNYGEPFPLFRHDDVVCECGEFGQHWRVELLHLLIYLVAIIGLAFIISTAILGPYLKNDCRKLVILLRSKGVFVFVLPGLLGKNFSN